MENTRKQKRINKEKIKDIITTVIAKIIYYSITTIFSVACILLLFGALGAIVDLCMNNKIYCICYFIVCGSIIVRWIIKEIK